MLQLTEKLKAAFASSPLYSQDGKGINATVIAKFFIGSATWLITEAEKEESGDYLLYGYCLLHEGEFGYLRFSDLQKIKVNGVFEVEQDLYLTEGITVKNALLEMGQDVPVI